MAREIRVERRTFKFSKIIEASNVKRQSSKFQKFKNAVTSFKDQERVAEKESLAMLPFYTQLDMLSFILLVIVWCMIWFSCFKADYFWDRLSGSPSQSYYYYFNCSKFEARTKFCCWLQEK